MTRLLDERLRVLRARKEGAFVPFLVVGDPSPDAFSVFAERLVQAGADALELGFPFSDPPADGPTIQEADTRALRAGVTPSVCFKRIAQLRARHEIPISLLLYYNLVLQHGVDRFYGEAADAGIDAILIADLPVELAQEAVKAAQKHRVAPVFIASAHTSETRRRRLAEVCEGYVYTLARSGITGNQGGAETTLEKTIEALRQVTALPLLAGFGLSEPAHVRHVLERGADGAIVGSAIVRVITEHLNNLDQAANALFETAQALKSATLPQL